MRAIFCPVFVGDHHRRTAVGDQRAIQDFKRVSDGAGLHHVFDRDGVAHLRFGVLAGPGAARHSGLGKLGFGGAKLIHVRAGDQRVISRDSRPIGLFVVGVSRARLHHHRLIAGHEAAQAIGHRHDDRVCHAGLNGGRRHVERHESSAAAGIDGDTVSRLPADVLGHRLGVIHDGFGKGVAGNQSVDLSQGQASILNGIEGDLYAELAGAFVRHDAHVALGHADQRKLSPQPRYAHRSQLAKVSRAVITPGVSTSSRAFFTNTSSVISPVASS